LEYGVQLWAGQSAKAVINSATLALRYFDYHQLWVTDNFLQTDPFTVLSVLAIKCDRKLGTDVTSVLRNPLDLASRFGAIQELSEDKEVAMGLGIGGTLQERIFGRPRLSLLQESVRFLRELLAGHTAYLSDYPEVCSFHHMKPSTPIAMKWVEQSHTPIYIAAGGPRTLALAAQYGDGVIINQPQAMGSIPGLRNRVFQSAYESVGKEAFSQRKKIFSSSISVSRNSDSARARAKRHVSYGLVGTLRRYPHLLPIIDVRSDEIRQIDDALARGIDIEEACKLLSDETLTKSGFCITGNPNECLKQLSELHDLLEGLGFEQIILGAPIGPDEREAFELIGKEILPSL